MLDIKIGDKGEQEVDNMQIPKEIREKIEQRMKNKSLLK